MRAGWGQHLDSGLPRAAVPAATRDCDRQCATERAAGRRRDLTGLRRSYGVRGETGHEGVQRYSAHGYPSRLAGG